MSTPGKIVWDLHMKRSFNIYFFPRQQWMRQNEFDDIDVLWMVLCSHYFTIDSEIKPVDIPPLLFIRKIKICFAIFYFLVAKCSLIVFECVWPQMKPDQVKCIGRMIDVFDL